jgi:hypothetical protein
MGFSWGQEDVTAQLRKGPILLEIVREHKFYEDWVQFCSAGEVITHKNPGTGPGLFVLLLSIRRKKPA